MMILHTAIITTPTEQQNIKNFSKESWSYQNGITKL